MLTDIRALVDPFLCALTNINTVLGQASLLPIYTQKAFQRLRGVGPWHALRIS
jgi:hypothetical protein